jgi:hypothetical protein
MNLNLLHNVPLTNQRFFEHIEESDESSNDLGQLLHIIKKYKVNPNFPGSIEDVINVFYLDNNQSKVKLQIKCRNTKFDTFKMKMYHFNGRWIEQNGGVVIFSRDGLMEYLKGLFHNNNQTTFLSFETRFLHGVTSRPSSPGRGSSRTSSPMRFGKKYTKIMIFKKDLRTLALIKVKGT